MDPTSVKEPVVTAAAELKATAMNAAANHQSLGATISRPARLLGANESSFIEPALQYAVRSDNGTTVPLWLTLVLNQDVVARATVQRINARSAHQ